MKDELLHLKVVGREGIVYEGDVSSISSYNTKGKFDVLPQHANFISLIGKGLTLLEFNGDQKEIKFEKALLRVRANIVEVYVGIEGMQT